MRQLFLILGVLTAAFVATAMFFVMLVVTGAPLTAAVLPPIALRAFGICALATGFVCQPLVLFLAQLHRLSAWTAALAGIVTAVVLALILGGTRMLADAPAIVLMGASGGLVLLPFVRHYERMKDAAARR